MSPIEFHDAMLARITFGKLSINSNIEFINFWNINPELSTKVNGAYAENNRYAFTLNWNSSHTAVKIEQRIHSAYSNSGTPRTLIVKRMRAKTATPEKIFEYLAKFLETIHTQVPVCTAGL